MTDAGVQTAKTKRSVIEWYRIAGLAALIVSVAAVIILANHWMAELKIRRVLIDGNQRVTAEEIVRASQIKADMLLFGIDLRRIENNVRMHPYVDEVQVSREIPDAIRIEIAEREPIAALPLNQIMYLDETGIALPPLNGGQHFDVPLVTGAEFLGDIEPGSRVKSIFVQRALAVLREARVIESNVYQLISEVHVNAEGNVTLFSLDNGIPVHLGRDVSIEQLKVFETFWNSFVPERGAEQLRSVDLRFDGQVVARWENRPATQSQQKTF